MPAPDEFSIFVPGEVWTCGRGYAERMHANAKVLPWFNEHVVGSNTDECIVCPHVSKGNLYPRALIDGKRVRMNRYACELGNGPAPHPSMYACHSCPGGDQRGCVNPRHLYWGTHAENMRDKAERGSRHSGEGHPSARLTWAIVDEIREKHVAGRSTRSLAIEYGIPVSSSWNICNHRSWKHRESGGVR
jgi:hypothetical protein